MAWKEEKRPYEQAQNKQPVYILKMQSGTNTLVIEDMSYSLIKHTEVCDTAYFGTDPLPNSYKASIADTNTNIISSVWYIKVVIFIYFVFSLNSIVKSQKDTFTHVSEQNTLITC